MHTLLFLSSSPAFYKVKLYNRISERTDVFVVWMTNGHRRRNKNFYAEEQKFESVYLGDLKGFRKYFKLYEILSKKEYRELVISGWDNKLAWLAVCLSPKRKNSVVVESSYLESKTTALKGFIKRVFLSRVTKSYCPGKSNVRLLDGLNFKGKVVVTKGVGLYNMVQQPPYVRCDVVKSFIYVGRLSAEKNLALLISVFNELPDLTLNVVGFGPMEEDLKNMAGGNVCFHGAVDNEKMYQYYQQNDVFVLPSVSETWGLVVEEALNNGLPVIVSDKVGCAEEIVSDGQNGFVFESDNKDALKESIRRITDAGIYNGMRFAVSQRNPQEIETFQVEAYL